MNNLKTVKGGKFIVLEGIDKCGKTTLIEKLYQSLKNDGYDVIKTREPGGVKISESIRDIILDKNNTEMDYKTEALLYAASRMQHLKEVILPALEQDKIVLCDRYILSSMAYQGIGRCLSVKYIMDIHDYENIKKPDLNLILHCNLENIPKVLNRGRKEEDNRMDLQTQNFYCGVSSGYKLLSKKIRNCKLIDCFENNEDELFKIVKYYLYDCIL